MTTSCDGGRILATRLLDEALAVLEGDVAPARRHIENARMLIGHDTVAGRAQKGSLADWQLQRVEGFIRKHLGTRLRISPVAQVVNLSPSYFSRAFKVSKGMSYSDFVLNARIELAKQLLMETDMAIAQVALQCGLADQSHLTRVFARAIGMPPRMWRYRRRTELGEFAAAS